MDWKTGYELFVRWHALKLEIAKVEEEISKFEQKRKEALDMPTGG